MDMFSVMQRRCELSAASAAISRQSAQTRGPLGSFDDSQEINGLMKKTETPDATNQLLRLQTYPSHSTFKTQKSMIKHEVNLREAFTNEAVKRYHPKLYPKSAVFGIAL